MPAGPLFQSLHLLGLLGVRESGADGYTLYALDPDSGLNVEKCSSGWAVPGTGRDGVRVISFSLRAERAEMARLVFGFLAAEIPQNSQIVLSRIMSAVEAVWDFAQDTTSTRIRDLTPNRLDGQIVNLPARAMKGWNWDGSQMNWQLAPEQYGAIHFHDDDIYDCGWLTDFSFRVPEGLRSGVYAAHVRSDGHEDYIPFYIRPKRGAPTADIAFLAPTADYMAYANDHNAVDATGAEMVTGRLVVLQPQDLHIGEHRELPLVSRKRASS